MKKYQMPNVKEVRLESSLFIMDGTSGGSSYEEQIKEPGLENLAPRHL
ncbi:MAG: hypothetical protein MJZ20_14475 [Bacteroidaceae bacterium]|nr:hypothetical protein [Bacteroidaceae bacterium]